MRTAQSSAGPATQPSSPVGQLHVHVHTHTHTRKKERRYVYIIYAHNTTASLALQAVNKAFAWLWTGSPLEIKSALSLCSSQCVRIVWACHLLEALAGLLDVGKRLGGAQSQWEAVLGSVTA